MIGEMRHRISVEQSSGTADGMGGYTSLVWTEFAKVWAKIEPKTARENFEKKELKHQITHKVTVRYIDGLASDMRLKFGDRYFQIKGIRIVLEKTRYMELDCKEGAPA